MSSNKKNQYRYGYDELALNSFVYCVQGKRSAPPTIINHLNVRVGKLTIKVGLSQAIVRTAEVWVRVNFLGAMTVV